ncbi:hypothetical protein CF642_37680 [Burkholderia pseudomallei]|nr:hypothetical protein CF642_37680 [Burkholderia pseudomallei]
MNGRGGAIDAHEADGGRAEDGAASVRWYGAGGRASASVRFRPSSTGFGCSHSPCGSPHAWRSYVTTDAISGSDSVAHVASAPL